MEKTKETEKKCFWRIDGVDSNGDIIVRVFNKEKQDELNALVGKAKAKYTREQNKVRKQDDSYAELVDIMGFEAVSEMFSTAGKSYVYNVKREMAKDAKAEQNKKALLDGAASAREAKRDGASKDRAPRVEKQALVITEEGAW